MPLISGRDIRTYTRVLLVHVRVARDSTGATITQDSENIIVFIVMSIILDRHSTVDYRRSCPKVLVNYFQQGTYCCVA